MRSTTTERESSSTVGNSICFRRELATKSPEEPFYARPDVANRAQKLSATGTKSQN